MTGELSISNKRYEPPCKSKPRLIFLSKIVLLRFKKLDEEIKIKNNEIKLIISILSFEKYNTLFKRKLFLNFLRIH